MPKTPTAPPDRVPGQDLFRPADYKALSLARALIGQARHGALGVLQDGAPLVTRIAVAPEAPDFLTLVSDLAAHTGALRSHPVASLMLGDPGKGDPLAHPRMTLQVRASFLEKTAEMTEAYLKLQPKARLYIGFADFHLLRLTSEAAMLNGGFAKAYRLTRADLTA